MKLSFVVAVSENNVIGIEGNKLPWHLPDDLKFFKKQTMGKPIIMGRKTFLSFGKALPGRTNIILSRSLHEAPEGTVLFSSMEQALDFLKEQKVEEACIIGGGKVFSDSWALVEEVMMTRVHTNISGGTAFFNFPHPDKWQRVWSEAHQKDERHAFDFTFEQWKRIKA